jgi:hypothetical protein
MRSPYRHSAAADAGTVTRAARFYFTEFPVGGGPSPVPRFVYQFTNAAGPIVAVNHGLGELFVQVALYDDLSNSTGPVPFTLVNPNLLTLNLTSFGAFPGTWTVLVSL